MIDLLVSICVVIVCLVSSSSIALSCVVKVSFAVFKLFIVFWFAVINWFNSVIFAELSVPWIVLTLVIIWSNPASNCTSPCFKLCVPVCNSVNLELIVCKFSETASVPSLTLLAPDSKVALLSFKLLIPASIFE